MAPHKVSLGTVICIRKVVASRPTSSAPSGIWNSSLFLTD